MTTFLIDPLHLVVEVAERRYGRVDVLVQFDSGLEYPGCTEFGDPDETPIITLNPNIPFYAVVEILAHELAHVLAGESEEHGEAWEEVFSRIHEDFEEAVKDGGNYDTDYDKRLEEVSK